MKTQGSIKTVLSKLVLQLINSYRLFKAKFCLYMYIKYIGFVNK